MVDTIYRRLEALERAIGSYYKGSEGGLYVILDEINQIYDLLAALRKKMREECEASEPP